MSIEVGNESVNHGSCDLTVCASLTICCALRYIEDLQLRIASVERLVKLVSQGYQCPPQHTIADLSQYAPDQDLGDLLDDDRGGPALPPPSNPILPSRFLLPSGERVDAHPSRGAKDAEVSIIADTAHTHRGEYHGSASVHGLVESALEFRDGAKYRPMTFKERFPNRRQEFWEVQSVSLPLVLCLLWQCAYQPQWMSPQPGPSSSCLEFPPADIIAPLVDTYFSHSNIYFPILHRPTFQRLLDQDLHQRNHEFGSLLLVVCAIGARFTNHPYLSDVPPGAVNCRVAHWLSQTRRVMKNPFTSTATLFEVQYFCVSRLFVRVLAPGVRVETPSFPAARYMHGWFSHTNEVGHSRDRREACRERWGKSHEDIRKQAHSGG